MKIKFDAELGYQKDAVDAVTEVIFDTVLNLIQYL